MNELPAPGTYPAKLSAAMVVYEADSGSLCVAIPVALENVQWSGKYTATVGLSDGALQTKSIANLRKCFPKWDGVNPFDLEGIEPGQDELDVVGDHDTFTPKATEEEPDPQPVEVFKIKWLNPRGGGVQMKEPLDEAGKKKVLTKWGSKFKAVSGSSAKPATTAPAKPATKTETKPAANKTITPPSRKAASKSEVREGLSTQDDVFTAYVTANGGEQTDELANSFWEACDKIAPGKMGDLTPEQWSATATELGL